MELAAIATAVGFTLLAVRLRVADRELAPWRRRRAIRRTIRARRRAQRSLERA